MKKLIAIVLIITLAVPALAMADFDKAPFLGTWSGLQHMGIYPYDTVLHYLFITESGMSVYMAAGITRNSGNTQAELATAIYRGTWEAVDDNTMRIMTSAGTYIDIFFEEGGDLVSYSPHIIFIRMK